MRYFEPSDLLSSASKQGTTTRCLDENCSAMIHEEIVLQKLGSLPHNRKRKVRAVQSALLLWIGHGRFARPTGVRFRPPHVAVIDASRAIGLPPRDMHGICLGGESRTHPPRFFFESELIHLVAVVASLSILSIPLFIFPSWATGASQLGFRTRTSRPRKRNLAIFGPDWVNVLSGGWYSCRSPKDGRDHSASLSVSFIGVSFMAMFQDSLIFKTV
jgi:hypothetical protein